MVSIVRLQIPVGPSITMSLKFYFHDNFALIQYRYYFKCSTPIICIENQLYSTKQAKHRLIFVTQATNISRPFIFTYDFSKTLDDDIAIIKARRLQRYTMYPDAPSAIDNINIVTTTQSEEATNQSF